MNYRRGFQRIYALLTVAWVVLVLLILPADRLNFWKKSGIGGGGPVVTSVTWSRGETPEIDFTVHGKNFQQNSLVNIAEYTLSGGWRYLASLQPNEATADRLVVHYAGVPGNGDLVIVENSDQKMSRPMPFVIEQPKRDSVYRHITLEVPTGSRLQRFIWLLGLLMLPPAISYAAFFHIVPWIFRGFKPTTKH